jgi:hypothetical protein
MAKLDNVERCHIINDIAVVIDYQLEALRFNG